MAENIDCAVIGAGVVGLSIARELALAGREVIILEAESAFGTHTSARNSDFSSHEFSSRRRVPSSMWITS